MHGPKFVDGMLADITCPEHGMRLVVRTTRKNGHQFLGCPVWPNCKHTQPIPEEWKMRIAGQKEFDFGENYGLAPGPRDDEDYGLGEPA